MTRQAEFLAAIREAPDDDDLRVVFADWLDDHGKPYWASVIREQIRNTQPDPDGLEPEWPDTTAGRIYEPKIEHIDRLRAEMNYPVSFEEKHLQRGLVSWLSLETTTLLEQGELLADWGPMPRIRLLDPSDHLDALVGWSALRHVDSLSLARAGLRDDHLRRLLESPYLRQVRELDLGNVIGGPYNRSQDNRLTSESARLLATTSELPALTHLSLMSNTVGDRGTEVLLEGTGLPSLRYLVLRHCGIVDVEFDSVSVNPWPKLQYLDLSSNSLTPRSALSLARSVLLSSLLSLELLCADFPDEAVCELTSSDRVASLKRLDLRGGPIGNSGFLALARSPALAQLRQLQLEKSRESTNPIDSEGAIGLSKATFASRLRVLELTNHRIGDAGLIALANSDGFPQLERLDLDSNEIGDAGVIALTRASGFERLEELDLANNNIGEQGAKALAEWQGLLRLKSKRFLGNPLGQEKVTLELRHACRESGGESDQRGELDLEGDKLGDEGLARLTSSPELIHCRELWLGNNRISARGAYLLATCPNMVNVEGLSLAANPIGDEGAIALASSPHLQNLRVLELSWSRLTDVGVFALVASEWLGQLRVLDIGENPDITPAAIEILLQANWPEMERLHVSSHILDSWWGEHLIEKFGEDTIIASSREPW